MENIRRSIQGVVVSDKMDKTITVLVETHKKHAKYKAHDEENVAKVGDLVAIEETRPLSATKRFRLVKVVAKAEDVK